MSYSHQQRAKVLLRSFLFTCLVLLPSVPCLLHSSSPRKSKHDFLNPSLPDRPLLNHDIFQVISTTSSNKQRAPLSLSRSFAIYSSSSSSDNYLSETSSNSVIERISSNTTPHYLDGMEPILSKQTNKQYKTFLLDMWGVMHDGSSPYEGVLQTISKLKQLDDTTTQLVILSNSSKRKSHSIKMLTKLGFNVSDFDQIITSGEIAYQMLSNDPDLACEIWPVLTAIPDGERKIFILGSGSNDREYCTSCGWTVTSMENANLILARGTFTIDDGSDNEAISKTIHGEEAYFKELERVLNIAASRKLPMLISNPDKVRPDKGLPPMPGAIGDKYEEMLGGGFEATKLVKRIGKPFSEVYDIALKKGSPDEIDPSHACMVGDALETDVTGGIRAGCDTIWVIQDGIHGPNIASMKDGYETNVNTVLETFNGDKNYSNEDRISPTFVIPHFRW